MDKCLPICAQVISGDLNDEEREGEDVAMEAEDKCTVQVKDCRDLWKLDKVRGRVSFGAFSRNLALRTPGFEDFSPGKLMVGFCPQKWPLN